MATYSSTPAWKSPWTEEPDRLQSIVSQRVGPDWSDSVLCIYVRTLFLAVLGLRCCAKPFSSCSNWGLLSSWAVWASHCGGFSCCRAWALGHVGLRSCGAQAYLPHGKWNLLRLGIKSMSPTLAGGFLITGPVGKSTLVYIWSLWWLSKISPVCMNSPHRTWFHISSLPWSFSQWMCLYLFGSLLKCSVQTNSNILNVVYV